MIIIINNKKYDIIYKRQSGCKTKKNILFR